MLAGPRGPFDAPALPPAHGTASNGLPQGTTRPKSTIGYNPHQAADWRDPQEKKIQIASAKSLPALAAVPVGADQNLEAQPPARRAGSGCGGRKRCVLRSQPTKTAAARCAGEHRAAAPGRWAVSSKSRWLVGSGGIGSGEEKSVNQASGGCGPFLRRRFPAR